MIQVGDLLQIKGHSFLVVEICRDVVSKDNIKNKIIKFYEDVGGSSYYPITMKSLSHYRKNEFLEEHYEIVSLENNSRHILQKSILEDLLTA